MARWYDAGRSLHRGDKGGAPSDQEAGRALGIPAGADIA